jgi:hypothetical protein
LVGKKLTCENLRLIIQFKRLLLYRGNVRKKHVAGMGGDRWPKKAWICTRERVKDRP